ncbi:hypothetical protein [Vibrio owensii]|uniref:hypothetical protein n=1 Tax=Vibrio harveyi group TaxID=717610 RepID=UPI003CC57ACB
MTGKLHISTNIPESDQEDSFQDSSTAYAGNQKLAVAIAVTPVFTDTDDQEAIAEQFRKDVQPLLDKGWDFTVQIGPSHQAELP